MNLTLGRFSDESFKPDNKGHCQTSWPVNVKVLALNKNDINGAMTLLNKTALANQSQVAKNKNDLALPIMLIKTRGC